MAMVCLVNAPRWVVGDGRVAGQISNRPTQSLWAGAVRMGRSVTRDGTTELTTVSHW